MILYTVWKTYIHSKPKLRFRFENLIFGFSTQFSHEIKGPQKKPTMVEKFQATNFQ